MYCLGMSSTRLVTIRRNTKLGQRILTSPARVCAYSLSNGFSGADVDVARFAANMATDIASDNAPTIRTTARDGWYSVNFHSNRWYEVRLEPEAD